MKAPLPFSRGDAFELAQFLNSADLSTAGVGEPDVALWIDLDSDGRIVGSVGLEFAGRHALVRGIAVAATLRGNGRGRELVGFAFDQARARGADTAWLLTRRAAGFCARLGFAGVDVAELADALPDSHRVRALRESGLLRYETAWSRSLTPLSPVEN
jgi:N-acetylglutamate synthase-like GNAT family acetyltransferase